MSENAAEVPGRRELHFESVDDILADAEQVMGKPHRAVGNWSAAQILEHLALAFNRSVDGSSYRPPFFVRWAASLLKRRILKGPMPSGFKMPKAMQPDFMPPDNATDQNALEELHTSINRYKSAAQLAPNVALGKLSREEWDKLHLRHAEMHLGFIVPSE